MQTRTTVRREPPRPEERFSYRFPTESAGLPRFDATAYAARQEEEDAFNEAVARILLAQG